jgi:putative hemolysin
MDTTLAAVPSLHPYPLLPTALPEPETGEGLYRLGFARDAAELDAVLRLRFEVFNAELGEGLAASWETGRDEDEFDLFCHECVADGAVETGEMELPQLFETYLRFGGKACSEPALDRRFGTIDFLVLLDTHAMDPRSHRMFFG